MFNVGFSFPSSANRLLKVGNVLVYQIHCDKLMLPCWVQIRDLGGW